MRYLERSEKILELLSGVKYLSYDQLQKEIGHSSSTIRRDISKLNTKGLVNVLQGVVSINSLSTNQNMWITLLKFRYSLNTTISFNTIFLKNLDIKSYSL